jgi:hypothetical protein
MHRAVRSEFQQIISAKFSYLHMPLQAGCISRSTGPQSLILK